MGWDMLIGIFVVGCCIFAMVRYTYTMGKIHSKEVASFQKEVDEEDWYMYA